MEATTKQQDNQRQYENRLRRFLPVGFISFAILIIGIFSFIYLKNNDRVSKEIPALTASLSLKSPVKTVSVKQSIPITLYYTIGKDETNRGIVSVQATLQLYPYYEGLVKPETIETTLPAPWQYLRKTVNPQGEIVIEALYLQPGEKGYISKEKNQPVAIIHLSPNKEGKISVKTIKNKSEIRAKEGNKTFVIKESAYTFTIK